MLASKSFPHRTETTLSPDHAAGLDHSARRLASTATGSQQQPSGVLIGVSELADNSVERLAENFPRFRVLVVDDDPALRRACSDVIANMGFEPVPVESTEEARELIRYTRPDLMLLDLKLRGGEGIPLLREVKERSPDTAVVVMTAFASVSSAVEAMRIGAGDYLTKPFALEELTGVLFRAAERVHFDTQSRQLRDRLRNEKGLGNLIGRSPEMEKVYRILSKVAFSTHPVLILGESGTGKELVARSIHAYGPNPGKPFVAVDCGALVPTSMEGELFGCGKGEVAGTAGSKDGLLSAADGGTVYLDEIGELSLHVQAKLLRALHEKQVRPVGAEHPVPLTVRVLAASSRDLTSMVTQGRFRKDLFFRLNVVNLRLPALRDRKQDIPVLAEYFLERGEAETGVAHTFSAEAIRAMTDYDWPGNVRELEHAIERACALSSGPVLHMADLPTQLHDFRQHFPVQPDDAGAGGSGPAPILSIADMEKRAILETIRQLNGDKLMAARLLGIGKTTLYRKLKEYGISGDEEPLN